jgi:hypothetical protein
MMEVCGIPSELHENQPLHSKQPEHASIVKSHTNGFYFRKIPEYYTADHTIKLVF